MRSPTKHGTEQRVTESAGNTSARSNTETTPPNGEGPVVEQRSVVTSMVDALEDILQWERASERALRVAAEQKTTELDPSN